MISPFCVANISDSSSGFKWLEGRIPSENKVEFRHFDRSPKNLLERQVYQKSAFSRPDITGYRACAEAAMAAARGQVDLLVTHLPTFAVRTAAMRKALSVSAIVSAPKVKKVPHIAWAFNFTHLPTGSKRAFFKRLCPDIDRFVVFSSMERGLYSDYLGIPKERIDYIPWCIEPPEPSPESTQRGDFLLSVGRTGRDYGVLMRAMARVPHCKAVVVASPESVEGLEIPPNVEVKIEIPYEEVTELTHACRFIVIPLHESPVPFGHGVLVHGMFLKRALIVNRTEGFDDYVQDENSCLSFGWGNDEELAAQINRLWADQSLATRLADTAFEFAQENCTEEDTVRYFMNYVEQYR